MNSELTSPLAAFLDFVAQGSPSELESIRNDLEAVYTHLGMLNTGSMASRNVYRRLADGIATAIASETKGPPDEDLATLRDDLLMRHVLDDQQLQPAFRILEHLIDATRQNHSQKPMADSTAWREAVRLGKDCIVFDNDPGSQSMQRVREAFPRRVNVAEAARRLRVRGVRLQIRNARVMAEEADLRVVGEQVLQRIRKLGGLFVARIVFPKLTFNSHQGRYLLAENVSTHAIGKKASVPIGYLLQLAARSASEGFLEPQDPGAAHQLWSEACEISTDLVAIYDAERYSMWEGMFHTPSTLVPFLQRLAIRDSAFSLQQMRPSDLERLLRGLFDWVDEKEVRSRIGFRIADAIRVAVRAIAVAAKTRGPRVFRTNKLADAITTANKKDVNAIFRCYVHENGAANKEYLFPTDVHRQTLSDRPFLPIAAGKVVILDASWAAPAFFNALLLALQGEFGEAKVNDEIGRALERLVNTSLLEKGIASVGGKYKATQGEDGECDVVVNASESLIFIETKLRLMTANARSGSDVSLLVDLSRSLVRAQVQLGGHEARIRRDHQLVLHKDGRQTTVSMTASQGIERIALTTLDYGALQDRLVLDAVLRTAANASFHAINPVYQKSLNELRDRGQELERQYVEIKSMVQGGDDHPFFNCWFLSLPQLFMLLDTVIDADSFWKRLRSIRHVTTGRLDLYADLAFSEQIRGMA
jgi:hypothetical protein